jgi:chromosome partitioning protein
MSDGPLCEPQTLAQTNTRMTNGTIRAAAFIDKGGTGKTTAAAHLGVALGQQGHEVLLIDLAGKQGDLVKHFGQWDRMQEQIKSDNDWPNISTVFDSQWDTIVDRLGEAAIDDMIIETGEDVDVIPAHPGLDSLDADLGTIDDARERYSKLDQFLTEYIDPRSYDVVLIDLPGATNNVSYNGLWATQNVIAPVEMGPFESEQTGALSTDLEKIGTNFNIGIELVLVLPNKVDTRTKLAKEYLDSFTAGYPESIAPEHIPVSQDIRNAAEHGRTVFALEEPSQTAQRAREAFLTNATTLVERLQGERVVP